MVRTRAYIAAAVVSVALVSTFVADLEEAHAGRSPEVAAIIEGVDSASGRGTLLVTGKKVGKFKTFSVRDDEGAVVGAADLVFKSKDLVALQLPADLPAGDYRLALEPKRGAATLADFAYLATRFNFPPGRDVGIGTTSPLATLDVQGTLLVQDDARFLANTSTLGDTELSGALTVGEDVTVVGDVDAAGAVRAGAIFQSNAFGATTLDPDFDEATGNMNVATFIANGGAGARLRLESARDQDGFEFGHDVTGSFVIDDLDDNRLLELTTASRLSIDASGGTGQLFVNTAPISNGTCAITPRAGDAFSFGIFETDGDTVLSVAGRDVTLAQGDLTLTSGNLQLTAGGVGLTSGNVVLGTGDVGLTEGDVILTAGDVRAVGGDVVLDEGDVVVVAGDGFKPGGGSWAVVSDRRLKKDIEPLEGALDMLSALRGVTYEYRDPDAIGELHGRQTGFVAQEVAQVLPSWVGERRDGMKYVAPKGFEALAATALQELRAEKDAQVERLREENAALRDRLAELESRDADRDARLRRLEDALLGRDVEGAADER